MFKNDKFSDEAQLIMNLSEYKLSGIFKKELELHHLLSGILAAYDTGAQKILSAEISDEEALLKESAKITRSDCEYDGTIYYSEKVNEMTRELVESCTQDEDKVSDLMILEYLLKSEDVKLSKIFDIFSVKKSNLLSLIEEQKKNKESTVRERKSLIDSMKELMFSGNDAYFANGEEDYEDEEYSGFSDKNTAKMYGVDLTQKAEENKLDPVYCRDDIIEKMQAVLLRKKKNNPVLIGEPGVGKTAIVERLAVLINEKKVDEGLIGKKIISIDMASMVAGTKYRGEFEERIKSVLDSFAKEKDSIVFIDELHNIVGAGSAESSLDASNILKPYLASGDIQFIGASTINEYRKYIEKDSALERRFHTISVEEPSDEDCIKIIKKIRPVYEKFHGIRINDDAVDAAVSLSRRYINDRFLPDKAIDLIDEAQAQKRLSLNAQNYSDKGLLQKMDERMKDLFDEDGEFNAKKESINDIIDIKLQMKEKKREFKEKLISEEGFISEQDIAKCVSVKTGIPLEKIKEKEKNRLLELEKNLEKNVIGQKEAVSALARAVRRSRAGISDPNRPIGTFLFVGPTGVGKTYLCKCLAKELFNDENAIIRIDMSEYMEKQSVSKFLGSPPGYVGYEEGGQLTEAIRRKPFSIVLFDEVEKAHPDVYDAMLQIFDDGRLTDAKGRVVNFKNSIIVMTSNIGSMRFKKQNVPGFRSDMEEKVKEREKMKQMIDEEIKKFFKPEFLNRVDETVLFNYLGEEEIDKIVNIMKDELIEKLRKKNIEAKVDESVLYEVKKRGYNREYGARPLKRAFKNVVEDDLSSEILKRDLKDGDKISLFYDGKLIVKENEKEISV